jgi:hypothetical protein
MFRNDELRALRRLQRDSTPSPLVFVSVRGSPFTTAGFARMIERAAAAAGLELRAHPHMLRRACGYALANRGHDTRAIPRDAGVWVRGNCYGRVRRRLAGRNRPEAVAVVGWVGCKKAPTALARFWPGWVSARRRQPGRNSNRAGWIAEESDRATGLCAADWALTAYDGSASDAASRATLISSFGTIGDEQKSAACSLLSLSFTDTSGGGGHDKSAGGTWVVSGHSRSDIWSRRCIRISSGANEPERHFIEKKFRAGG